MNFKTIFKSFKNKEMRKRIFAVVGILIVYRILAHVPVPLGDATTFKQAVDSLITSTDLGGFINLISGGGLTNFSIILVGLSPYITSSIVMQLLTKAIPRMEELNNDGETGRRKIAQWTRILTVPLAIMQSFAYVYILFQQASTYTASLTLTRYDWAVAVTAMTAGSILLMWLGELITEQGIGNGISTVILCSIVSGLPSMLAVMGEQLFNTEYGSTNLFGWLTIPVDPTWLLLILGLAIGLIIVGIKSIMPIKLIAAGVVPVIFAVAFLSLPAFVGQLIQKNDASSQIAANLVKWFSAPSASNFTGLTWESFIYPVLYFLLVVMFTYFYTSIIFNSQEIAENLQKQGGFIEGVRPGRETEKYFNRTVNRLNLFGALALGLIAMLPYIADYIFIMTTGKPLGLSISGTGLLIIVTVAIENLRQINSRALMVTYDDYQE